MDKNRRLHSQSRKDPGLHLTAQNFNDSHGGSSFYLHSSSTVNKGPDNKPTLRTSQAFIAMPRLVLGCFWSLDAQAREGGKLQRKDREVSRQVLNGYYYQSTKTGYK